MGKHNVKKQGRAALLTSSVPFVYEEAYKTLRTNLSFASIRKQYKKIIITSATPNEGKSTVAINLAMTLAESDARVLLIDCDLRKSALRRVLRGSVDYKGGLTSVLTGEVPIDSCIVRHPKMKCDLLLTGALPPNPVELLSSPQMEKFLDQQSKVYDYIICDTPPVSIVTDAVALSRFCDGVILVVRQKASTREQVHAAKRSFDTVQANVIGTILSCYDMVHDTQAVYPPFGGYY